MIVSMYTRICNPHEVILFPGKRVNELFFIREGQISMAFPKSRENKSIVFNVLPRFSIFGDYQILFDLNTIYEFRAETHKSPGNEHLDEFGNEEHLDSYHENRIVLMCVQAKKLKHLCEIFPTTMANLKIRAL